METSSDVPDLYAAAAPIVHIFTAISAWLYEEKLQREKFLKLQRR